MRYRPGDEIVDEYSLTTTQKRMLGKNQHIPLSKGTIVCLSVDFHQKLQPELLWCARRCAVERHPVGDNIVERLLEH